MPDPSLDAPRVRFSQHTLENGLRVIVAPDRVAPVAAINLWYDVGSKHEQPGRTGFAHLFEHFMFQGSRHVAKAEHLGIVQGAGGVCNATTYFDRTNYFETLPSHEVELGLWLEADRMATLLDALSQENLDNQRDVVKNEKRQSLRQPALRLVLREAHGRGLPGRATRTTTRRSARWPTSTRRASRTSPRSSGPTTCPTTRC